MCVDEGSVRLEKYEVAHAVTEKEIIDIIEFMISKCHTGCYDVDSTHSDPSR